jgi:hypothetical protein
MPRRNGATNGEVVIEIPEGTCGDGCGQEVAKGRRYRQGHDAKLRGKLANAARQGQQVAIVRNGTRTTKAAADWLTGHGWPVPPPKEAKHKTQPKKKQARAKASA